MKIVIKVGTSTLAYPNGSLNIRRTEELCKVMSDLKNAGHEIILVSSGAIGMGVGSWRSRKSRLICRRNRRRLPSVSASLCMCTTSCSRNTAIR